MFKLRVAVAAFAVLLLFAGGASLVGVAIQRSEGGYFTTSGEWFKSPTAALTTKEIAVDSSQAVPGDPAGDVGDLAQARVRVRAGDPAKAIFVGVGPTSEVRAYLSGTAHEEFAGASFEPFRARFRRVPGVARADSPVAQPFWVATSVGAGTRTLEWDKSQGAWTMVVMSSDGEPGLGSVYGDIGLRFGFLLPLGIGLIVAALVLLVLVVVSGRLPRMSRKRKML